MYNCTVLGTFCSSEILIEGGVNQFTSIESDHKNVNFSRKCVVFPSWRLCQLGLKYEYSLYM